MKNLDLYKRICEEFGKKETVVQIDFVEIDGIKYTYCEEEDLETIDQGKYQLGGIIYGVGVLKDEKTYDIEEVLFYIRQGFTQTGSYYSYQEREFEKPEIVEKKEIVKTVWKAIK
jgi:hypothetical protein